MNILIYIPYIRKENGGVYQYAVGLLKLLQNNQTHTFFILHDKTDEAIREIVNESPYFTSIEFTPEKTSFWQSKRIIKAIRRRFFSKGLESKSPIEILVESNSIDIVHCPYQNYVETGTTPFITTMHDVQELHFPEFFSSTERAYRATEYKKAIELSDEVVVSYEHVKNDLVKFFDVKPESIEVILINMTKLWIDDFNNKDIIEREELSLPNRFLLYPAATWKHKNHLFLLRALKELKDEGIAINLVFTGNLTDHYHENISVYIENNDLGDQCIFKGIVSDAELFSLYKHTNGVVIPTLYEAGSFPLYESILLNVPAICSNATSLPETIKNEDLVFDVNKIKSLKDLLVKLYFDEKFGNSIKQHFIERSAQIRSNDSLNKFLRLYDKIMSKKP